ncbi:unnamed protein product [Cuscuta campestris]|uniref:Uncharacterized protein n=1 Tax=Cuscuta campestris TaxID=132261 RepID=A0A484MYD4_9ASTE|nr:unnamed protein product [Cuscuta campestris]
MHASLNARCSKLYLGSFTSCHSFCYAYFKPFQSRASRKLAVQMLIRRGNQALRCTGAALSLCSGLPSFW